VRSYFDIGKYTLISIIARVVSEVLDAQGMPVRYFISFQVQALIWNIFGTLQTILY